MNPMPMHKCFHEFCPTLGAPTEKTAHCQTQQNARDGQGKSELPQELRSHVLLTTGTPILGSFLRTGFRYSIYLFHSISMDSLPFVWSQQPKRLLFRRFEALVPRVEPRCDRSGKVGKPTFITFLGTLRPNFLGIYISPSFVGPCCEITKTLAI